MKRALITHLHAVAKERRDGYLEACLKAGKISRDGQWMIFDDDAYTKIRRQFNPVNSGQQIGVTSANHLPLTTNHSPGLGDIIHKIAGPIGRAIHWPCLKGDGTTNLKPNSRCDRARQRLNKVKIQSSA
jgi:hypothetical protein